MRGRISARLAISALRDAGARLSCAESCTGGLIADSFVRVAGASDVFAGGIVAYDARVKLEKLGVSARTLKRHGAVSEECAREMAEKCAEYFGTDIALSSTGYVDGEGDSHARAGTVFIALKFSGETFCEKLELSGTRNRNRREAAVCALKMLCGKLDGGARA